jgi:hypothetical protein
MGLKLGSEGGTPSAPPESRRAPEGQVAVVVLGGLFSALGPTGAETLTTVVVGPPVPQLAKAVAWSPASFCPPKPATAVQLEGVGEPSVAGLPALSEGMVPLSLSPFPGMSAAEELRRRKAPPPTSVLPDGQLAVTLMAVAAALVIGVVVARIVTSGNPALAGAALAASVTSANVPTPVASTISTEATSETTR